MDWGVHSYRQHPNAQPFPYEDRGALEEELRRLRDLPPLVSPHEVEALRAHLAECEAGNAFALMAGDCAERFVDSTLERSTSTYWLLVDAARMASSALALPVVVIGRMAGQFAKPRSAPTETRMTPTGLLTLPSYFGDLVNDAAFERAARSPDPRRLTEAHRHAVATRSTLRTLDEARTTELHHVSRVFTAHEALHLDWEAAQVRELPGHRFMLGTAHLPWIGDRTRQLAGAHVEFLRGLTNPVGVKLGPTATAREIVRLSERLNPLRQPGKLVLITRVGTGCAGRIADWVRALEAANMPASWMCDPMHGNTRVVAGRKRRDVESMVAETQETASVHAACGSRLAGLHLEVTCADTEECSMSPSDDIHGPQPICDPRLNARQTRVVLTALASTFTRTRST